MAAWEICYAAEVMGEMNAGRLGFQTRFLASKPGLLAGEKPGFEARNRVLMPQPITPLTTLPLTSVSRISRPAWRNVSFS